MNEKNKQLIRAEIARLSKLSSQNRVANRVGVSSATISQIINNNWRLIKPEMWRKIKVRLKLDLNWNTAPTAMFRDLTLFLDTAKNNQSTVSFSHQAGTGKSHLYNHYQRVVPNVIYIEGTKTMSKKTYIKKLLVNAGQDAIGTTEELMEQFIDHVSELEQPLIIIDQFDKLKENTFDLFMDFYNELYGHCGFVISGVKALEKRILMGVQRNKIGYEEIWSRMDRKFIKLYATTREDVKLIFEANGVSDKLAITESYNSCGGDLRRVKKDVLKYQLNND